MGGLLLKIRSWWETADRTQKAVTLFGSIFLVLLLGGTFYFASKPHMAMAFSGLDSQEVGSVTDEIQKLGIPVEYDLQGNVQVPSDKVAEVRAKLAVAGKLPASGHLGSGELSRIGMLNTEPVEKERLKGVLEDQLAQSIEYIKGIQKARVQIALGEQSAFATETKPATASVFISQAPGSMVTPDQGHAIAMLVSNGVNGLTPDKVFVVDNSGHPLFDGSAASDGSGQASQKLQAELMETDRRERNLQAALDTAFGHGNTLVKVNLELDFDKTDTDSVIHPASEAITTSQKREETMTGDSSVAGGISGAAANLATAPTSPTTPSSKGYKGITNVVDHPVDQVSTQKHLAVGSLKSMAITTLVNSAKIPDPKPVQDFIAGYLGPKMTDVNFKQTVTSTVFDTAAQQAADKAAQESAGRDRMQQMMSILPIGALILVAFLVIKAIGKAAKAQSVLVGALPGGGMIALDAQTPTHEAMSLSEGAASLDGHAVVPEEVAAIQEKLNLPLEQIKRMSDEKSENVAMLIKSWMLEDHR
jgi:flagellar M-ring protein FliF